MTRGPSTAWPFSKLKQLTISGLGRRHRSECEWQESQGLFGVSRCKIPDPTCVQCSNIHGIHDVLRAIYSISCFAYSDMIRKAPFSKIPFSLYPNSHYHYSRHFLTQLCRQGRTSHVLSLGAGSRFSVKLTWVHKGSQKHGEGLQWS